MRITKSLGALLAVMAALIAIPVANAAAETFEVSTAAGEGAFQAYAAETRFVDNGTEAGCNESAIAGLLKEGTEISGSEVGEITEATWNKGEETCTGPLGITFRENALTPWLFLAETKMNEGDLIGGEVHQIVIHLEGSLCSFTLTGGLPAIWHNQSQTLLFGLAVNEQAESEGWGTNTLTVENVSGCFGLVNNGDKPYFEGQYEAEAGAEISIR